jgi:hypothetical protein
MAVVVAIVSEAAPLRRQSTCEVCVGHTSCLKLLPEESTPTSLATYLAISSLEWYCTYR